MEAPKELSEDITSKHSAVPDKNISDSNIYVKRLSIVPDDGSENELRLVGLKVSLHTDQIHSAAADKRKSKSVDCLKVKDDSKKILKVQDDNSTAKEKPLQIPLAEVQNIQQRELNIEDNENSRCEPWMPAVLELKLTPSSKRNEFELQIRSKNDDRSNFVEDNEYSSSDCDCDEDQSTNVQEADCLKNEKMESNNPVAEDRVKEDIPALSSLGTQTDKEIDSCSVQTDDVQILFEKKTKEVIIQTEKTCDASTATDEKETKSTETETEITPVKQLAIQTSKENITGSSQTETAAVFSIDREYDASTQTDEVSDAATSTDFDIYIVDRSQVASKAMDTEELPFYDLMVAKDEKYKEDKRDTDDVKCICKCCSEKCVHKCCCHSHKNEAVLANPHRHCKDHAITGLVCTIIGCNQYRNCCEEEKMNNSYECRECRKQDTKSDVKDSNIVEKLETETFSVNEMEYKSIALRENLVDLSNLEIVKKIDNELQRINCLAVRIFCARKMERAAALKSPVVFQHFLNSSDFSKFRPSRIIINPINISMSLTQPLTSGSDTPRQLKESTGKALKPTVKEKGKQHRLTLSDGLKTRSVTLTRTLSSELDCDKHSQICLCKTCYSTVEKAVQRNPNATQQLPESSPIPRNPFQKASRPSKNRLTTSPKIKHKHFDYSSKDKWEPLEDTSDDVILSTVESTKIIHIGSSSRQESTESPKSIDLNSACETVNDHILSLRPVDEAALKVSAKTLHKRWFDAVGTKDSNVDEVRNYLRYFEEFSYNLLKTLLYSVDSNGNNVLHFAYANDRFDLVKELLFSGYASELLSKTNKLGNSPLMLCAISEPKTDYDWAIIRKSFEMGDVNSRSLKRGQTPLMNAASRGFCEMVELLLDVGVNPNAQDKDGSTALMYAAEHGHEKCIKVLLQHKKCDPTITDTDNQTACSIALSNGHKNIAVLIHMKTLERRRQYKCSSSTKRYAFTNKKVQGVSNQED